VTPPVSWSLELAPSIMAALLVAVYVRRWRAVRRSPDRDQAPVWRLASWISGALVLVVAQGNPIDELGDYLFAMHMVQHVLLLDVMPLLLLFGLNRVIMRPITRRVQWIEQRLGWFASPIFGIVLYTLGMWVWHVPALYDAALDNPTVHLLEHMTFTAIGFIYWWHVLRPIPTRKRLTGMGPVAYMAATKVSVGVLGVALTFAPTTMYDAYADEPSWWGMSPSIDQATGGAIMATEQVLIMGVAFGFLFIRGLRESELKAQREERLLDRREALAAGRALPEDDAPVTASPAPRPAGIALRRDAVADDGDQA